MSTTGPRPTAKIYAFPAGGRIRGGRNDWAAPSPAARERIGAFLRKAQAR